MALMYYRHVSVQRVRADTQTYIILICGKAMVYPSGQNDQIILFKSNSNPVVALAPDIKVPCSVANPSDLFVLMQVFIEEHLHLRFVHFAHCAGTDSDLIAVLVRSLFGKVIDGGIGGVLRVQYTEILEVGWRYRPTRVVWLALVQVAIVVVVGFHLCSKIMTDYFSRTITKVRRIRIYLYKVIHRREGLKVGRSMKFGQTESHRLRDDAIQAAASRHAGPKFFFADASLFHQAHCPLPRIQHKREKDRRQPWQAPKARRRSISARTPSSIHVVSIPFLNQERVDVEVCQLVKRTNRDCEIESVRIRN
jgi:hypothetical protein